MNIVQTFRRIGQQMNGWDKSIDSQQAQMPLIKKLYAKNGLEIQLTSIACPRHGEFTVDYPNVSGKEIMSECPNGDGIFDNDERLNYLSKAMRKVLLELQPVSTK